MDVITKMRRRLNYLWYEEGGEDCRNHDRHLLSLAVTGIPVD
jgi:hypothetical protein